MDQDIRLTDQPILPENTKFKISKLSWRWKLAMTVIGVVLVLASALAVYALFQDNDDAWASCASPKKLKPEIRIRDCGSVIESGKETGSTLARALTNRAMAFAEVDEVVSALKDFDAALAINSGDAGLFAARGMARLKNGNPKAAIEDFNSALALDAVSIDAMTGRGNAFLTLGNPEAAKSDFSQAIVLNPNIPDPVYRRAIANARLSNIVDAMADYDRVLEMAPGNSTYWNARCWFRATMGVDLDLALTDCDQAITLKPDNVAALDSRAFVLLRLARNGDALKAYDLVLARESAQAWPFFGRGIVKKRLGDVAGADADLARARQIQPKIDQEYLKFGEAP